MSSIYVGFSRPKTWKPFAALIMWAYAIPYDHVYIRWHSDFLERDVIYQASSTMVNFMSPVIFESNNVIVKEFELAISDENRKAMIQFAMDNAGKPYGIKQCVGLGIVRLCELFGKNIKNPFADGTNSYVCCELGEYIIEEFNNVAVPYNPDTLNPKQFYDFMEQLTGKV